MAQVGLGMAGSGAGRSGLFCQPGPASPSRQLTLTHMLMTSATLSVPGRFASLCDLSEGAILSKGRIGGRRDGRQSDLPSANFDYFHFQEHTARIH